MKQFCIDESGDTGHTSKSSKYFVLCAVGVENLDTLRKVARDVHRSKYKKKKGNTLHAYKENEIVKNKIVTKMSKLSIECVACVLDKQSNRVEDLYLKATDILADYFANKSVELVIVARKDNRKSYAEKIMKVYDSREIKASFSDPTKDKSLQIADFYSWSIFVKFEKLENNYFDKLKNITLLN